MKICAIILTKNEELHIERAIRSVINVVGQVLIIDSFSSDRTVDIAEKFDVLIQQNEFINHAAQLNFGIDQARKMNFNWILRLDADEFLDETLQNEIKRLGHSKTTHAAFLLKRQITFMRVPINYGGINPVKVNRLFDASLSYCEQRWMDEHIISKGTLGELSGNLIDDSLKPIDAWIAKHVAYSSKEAVEILLQDRRVDFDLPGGVAGIKRLVKLYLYNRLPRFMRAKLYYYFRMYIRFGILDTPLARQFHFFQAYWYRSLVDLKVNEVQLYRKKCNCSLEQAIFDVLRLKV